MSLMGGGITGFIVLSFTALEFILVKFTSDFIMHNQLINNNVLAWNQVEVIKANSSEGGYAIQRRSQD